ncbi:MAG: AAA family ATPase [Phycisphaerales bacterium]|nr:AAA family ATPase [Phycisphaerales bacterium]
MLKAIELENSKAFGQRTRIDLAPITLIFGQNSAGKSSILQSLNLLKQTRESRESGAPLLPRAEGGIADLGSFQELLFDHDLSRTLSIGLHVDARGDRNSPFRMREWFGAQPPESIGLSLRFQRTSPEAEVEMAGFDVSWPALDEPLASFSPRNLSKHEQRLVSRFYWHPARGRQRSQQRKLRAAECKRLSSDVRVWEPIFPEWLRQRAKISKALQNMQKEVSSTGAPLGPAGDIEDPNEAQNERQRWLDRLQSAIAFYSDEFSLAGFIERMTLGSRSAVVALDGLVPAPLGPIGEAALPEFTALDYRRSRERNVVPVLNISAVAPVTGRLVEDALEALFPMGPFRRPPERWYIFTGTSPEDVGYRGDLLPDLLFRRSDLIGAANKWLEQLGIGYALRVRPIGKHASDLFEVRLVDRMRSSEVEVALSDVGFGISQILPFLVQTLASNGQIISIEQPEVHIHPKLQADLGDLLAEAISEPYSHQFLVETHSEHLILRLQKLVRERRLKPADISVIFVSRGAEGSRARRLRLDESGRFIDEWPGGFFAERLRELR